MVDPEGANGLHASTARLGLFIHRTNSKEMLGLPHSTASDTCNALDSTAWRQIRQEYMLFLILPIFEPNQFFTVFTDAIVNTTVLPKPIINTIGLVGMGLVCMGLVGMGLVGTSSKRSKGTR